MVSQEERRFTGLVTTRLSSRRVLQESIGEGGIIHGEKILSDNSTWCYQ